MVILGLSTEVDYSYIKIKYALSSRRETIYCQHSYIRNSYYQKIYFLIH